MHCRFVYCRQRQDDRLKRGGEQKSLVLLSLYPFTHALSQVSQWAGPLYFNQGLSALQEVSIRPPHRVKTANLDPEYGCRHAELSVLLVSILPQALSLFYEAS